MAARRSPVLAAGTCHQQQLPPCPPSVPRPSLRPSVRPSVRLSVRLSVRPCVRLSVRLSVCPSVCRPPRCRCQLGENLAAGDNSGHAEWRRLDTCPDDRPAGGDGCRARRQGCHLPLRAARAATCPCAPPLGTDASAENAPDSGTGGRRMRCDSGQGSIGARGKEMRRVLLEDCLRLLSMHAFLTALTGFSLKSSPELLF